MRKNKTGLSGRLAAQLVLWLAVLAALLGGGSALAETITYFHNDIAGTPIAASDASGNVIWKENYQPFGGRMNNLPASGGNDQWFAGKPVETATGLSYFGARYYDPALGRFMGIDPKEVDPANLHSFNRYSYGNNNPFRYLDPDGLEAQLIQSHWALRALVPGQVAWDNARSAWANGNYSSAALWTTAMVEEQIMFAGTLGLSQAGSTVARGTMSEGVAAREVKVTAEQAKNVSRFEKKLPANAKDSVTVKPLPNDGVAVQATSPGRVPGSSAVYEKQIDAAGSTVQYTKTTYDPAGNIVHVKDKLNGGVFP